MAQEGGGNQEGWMVESVEINHGYRRELEIKMRTACMSDLHALGRGNISCRVWLGIRGRGRAFASCILMCVGTSVGACASRILRVTV